MERSSLTFGYAGPRAADPLALLRIEQEEWPSTTGSITTQEMLRMVGSTLVGSDYRATIDCGLVDGSLVCTVYAYPLVAGLVYRMLASWGVLSGPTVEMLTLAELVQFRLADSASPEYPARSILDVAWVDECYGLDGEIVSAPALSVDGENILSESVVYGTASVRYLCERHTYTLAAPRRESSFADHYGSVLVGVYAGGLVSKAVELPPGIEAFEADAAADCGSSWSGSASLLDDDEQDQIPEASMGNRRTVIDYCSQEIESDTYL